MILRLLHRNNCLYEPQRSWDLLKQLPCNGVFKAKCDASIRTLYSMCKIQRCTPLIWFCSLPAVPFYHFHIFQKQTGEWGQYMQQIIEIRIQPLIEKHHVKSWFVSSLACFDNPRGGLTGYSVMHILALEAKWHMRRGTGRCWIASCVNANRPQQACLRDIPAYAEKTSLQCMYRYTGQHMTVQMLWAIAWSQQLKLQDRLFLQEQDSGPECWIVHPL